MSRVAVVMREWASAIRGDWGGIDGRTCRDEIEALADFADMELTGQPLPPLAQIRFAAGVCPHGGGHWPDSCSDSACGSVEEGTQP